MEPTPVVRERRSRPPALPCLGLALALGIPSMGIVQKYMGPGGALAYLAAYALALGLAYWLILPRFFARVSPARARWWSIATWFALAGFVLVVYPAADSGRFGGGSDGDDALDLATTELLHGRYPYTPRTYLGNPLSPMPGSLVLAAPFVLAFGSASCLNLVALAGFFALVNWRFRDERWLLGLLLLVACTPGVLHGLATGTDYVANTLYVLVAAWWLVIAAERPRSRQALLLPAILLGLALSWRPNFVLIAPLVYSLVGQRAGLRSANLVALLVGGACALVTLPFYVYDPAGFSPLHVTGKLAQFDALLPHATLVVPGLAGLLALALARPHWNSSEAAFFRNCALVQAVPVLGTVLLHTVATGGASFDFLFFGPFFLFFGALGAWLSIRERWQPGPPRLVPGPVFGIP